LLIDQRDLVLARNSFYIAASGILKNPAFLLKRVDTTNWTPCSREWPTD